jgi:hypothetical protein
MVPPAIIDWVADSGTSNHTTSDVGNLTYIRHPHINDHSFIIVGNGSSLSVTIVGDMTIPSPFYLNNVLVTPDIIQNLLSVYHFTTDNWCSMEFDHFGLSVKDLSTRNVIIRCDSSRPLYTMRMPSRFTPSSYVAAHIVLVASASTCHRRLGHLGVDTMSKLSNASSVIFSMHTHDLCHTYQLGHHTRIPFVSSASRANNNFDLIHCDLWTSSIVRFFGASIIWLSLMITLILCEFFLCALNLTLFPHCQKKLPLFPCSLVAPSKMSNVTTVMSSTMPPPMHSLPLVGSSYGCHAHTPLRRMVKPSVLFALSIICSALNYFRPLCRLATGSKHSKLLRTC